MKAYDEKQFLTNVQDDEDDEDYEDDEEEDKYNCDFAFILCMLWPIVVPKQWIFFDNQSTVYVFQKRDLLYKHFGFCITRVLGDGEFEHMDLGVISSVVSLNILAYDEHLPDVERYIRTIQECSRSVYTSLPFKTYTNRLLVEILAEFLPSHKWNIKAQVLGKVSQVKW